MKKIVTVIGARPQFIKAAALSPVLRQVFDEVIIHTGQHHDYEMSQSFFQELHIPTPNHQLSVAGLPHGAMTGRMMEQIEAILLKEKPDCLLVFGDTNSTLAGALAASKCAIPIAHVEAGLRSAKRDMPEEINRRVTDQLATFHFCPTDTARQNLVSEGIASGIVMGDIMQDVAKRFMPNEKKSTSPYILFTLHRQENVDDPTRLGSLLAGLEEVAKKYRVVFPVHPRTKKKMATPPNGVELLPPQQYKTMLSLEKNAIAIATDSGGVQKEAYFFQTPCLILREETEWKELVEKGYSRLLKKDSLLEEIEAMIQAKYNWDPHLYGDGTTSQQITEYLDEYL